MNGGGAGDCFIAAYRLSQRIRGSVLVHGQPLLLCPPHCRYDHAWVEIGGVVLDFSNGLRVVIRATDYYRIGQIDDLDCLRWTADEAISQALSWGTYGPWRTDIATPAEFRSYSTEE